MRLTLWEPAGDVDDPDIVHSVLTLIVHDDTLPSEEEVATWTRIERLLAYDWAWRHYLRASDNVGIRIRPRPSFTFNSIGKLRQKHPEWFKPDIEYPAEMP
jgi:hypothetical protein